ncbi:hypothetical protein K4F52_008849 [Lecanicillium sp. MT-2017a]|nr:hypothetical protein K4F52_008849 [Lecanicillium sp. MT-2017a]
MSRLAEAAPITSGDRMAQLDVADDSSMEGSTPRALDTPDADSHDDKSTAKSKKRSLFGLGKKKQTPSSADTPTGSQPASSHDASQMSAMTHPTVPSTHASQTDHSSTLPASPNRALSTSPRLSSPAGSQIFERDVQDSTVLAPNSPAIPTHLQTDNYIPPVLNDASEAITNEKLDPDAVEIVTHTSHQPAAVTVTGTTGSPVEPSSEWAAELASFADRVGTPGETASNYGSLESADVRRLSFISFADVVQSEHSTNLASPASRDNMHIAGLTSLPAAALNRSPSPIRSPVSSQGPGTSPPTSNPGSMKGVEMSPRKTMGSPKSAQHSLNAPGGDLNIETMRQALRRTGSTELTRSSMPTSPIDGPGSR